jgi:hypothetical protein
MRYVCRGAPIGAFATLARPGLALAGAQRPCLRPWFPSELGSRQLKSTPQSGSVETQWGFVSREPGHTRRAGAISRRHVSWCFGAHPDWVLLRKHNLVLAWPKEYGEANTMNYIIWAWPHIAWVVRAGQADHSHPRKRTLYSFRKMNQPINFQPVKAHLNDVFYFFHQPTSWLLN